MLKYSDSTPASFEASPYSQSQYLQPDQDNGAEFYGILTLGTIAGVVFGIVTNQPFVGVFAGMGAGAMLGLGFKTGRHFIERLMDR